MRIVRFKKDSKIGYGIFNRDVIDEISCEAADTLTGGLPCDPHRRTFTGKQYPLEAVTLLAPCRPSKIVAVGLNYRSHAEEIKMPLPDEPLLFLKPSTAVIGPGDAIVYPSMSRRVDYEAELGVIIGAVAKNVSEKEAQQYILGYTCFNDVTARDLQGKDKQFTRSKSFDTFAPMGPWIETELDPGTLRVESYLGGVRKQSGTTADLVFSVYELLAFISKVMTLLPGDVIATGTPSGIGPMRVGDHIEIVVEGIGRLSNVVSGTETMIAVSRCMTEL
jgi:2-keto-4-pentenoate hydratase/2-oxohepta-3-ene-1,7-dioic acid hydratase in catechol pathway